MPVTDKLIVHPRYVDDHARWIEQHKNVMQNLMNTMQQKVTRLNCVWDSVSGRAYQDKYKNVTRNINACLTDLSHHVKDLKDAAQQYKTMEDQNVTTVDKLKTDPAKKFDF
jgi:uncharacterized protein YukE